MGLITETEKAYYEGSNFGSYRYISLVDIVDNFMISYVGDGKLLSTAKRTDIVFHAKRGMQEFSYDLSTIDKIQEFLVPVSLSFPLPQDYVRINTVSWVDDSGFEHPISPGTMTSKPSQSVVQDVNGNVTFTGNDVTTQASVTDERFRTHNSNDLVDYNRENMYYDDGITYYEGQRYGSDPTMMNRNGFYVLDEKNGKISFTSDLSGVLITLKYVSDSLGQDSEMKVHKFAEEAIYKHIAYSIVSTMVNIPEYIVNRYKKERRAALRNSKIRIMNISPANMIQAMRGKSKQIKH